MYKACCQCVYISACVIASLFLPLTWVLCAESKRAYHLSRDMTSSSDETNGPLPDDKLALYSILRRKIMQASFGLWLSL